MDTPDGTLDPTSLADRRHLNALRPFCRLPVELMCEVFLLYKDTEPLSSSSSSRCNDASLRLSQICHSLRDLALDIAPLWTDVDLALCSPAWVQELMVRAKTKTLGAFLKADASGVCIERMLAVISASASRLGAIDLEETRDGSVVGLLSHALPPTPMLQCLSFKGSAVLGPLAFPAEILQWDLPSLLILELEDCILEGPLAGWKSLAGLRLLRLKDSVARLLQDSPRATRATAHDLALVLQQTPKLQTLLLHLALRAKPRLMLPEKKTHLVSLLHCKLSAIDAVAAQQLFQHISFPCSLRRMACDIVPLPLPITCLPFLDALCQSGLKARFLTVNSVRISIRRESAEAHPSVHMTFWDALRFSSDAVQSRFVLQLHGQLPGEAVAVEQEVSAIMRTLRASRIQVQIKHVVVQQALPGDGDFIFSQFPEVQQLDLRDCHVSEQLLKPLNMTPGCVACPAPGLRRVEIEDCKFLLDDGVCNIFASRRRAGHKLKRLVLRKLKSPTTGSEGTVTADLQRVLRKHVQQLVISEV